MVVEKTTLLMWRMWFGIHRYKTWWKMSFYIKINKSDTEILPHRPLILKDIIDNLFYTDEKIVLSLATGWPTKNETLRTTVCFLIFMILCNLTLLSFFVISFKNHLKTTFNTCRRTWNCHIWIVFTVSSFVSNPVLCSL